MLIGLHNEDGALGLVLNRPSTSTVASAVPQLGELLDDEDQVFVGGPVQGTSIVMLAEFDDPAAAGLLVLGRIGLPGSGRRASSSSPPRPPAGEPTPATRAGRRGSSTPRSGRATGSPTTPCPTTSSARSPEQLWSSVLTRKGGRYALLARMPLDPSLN